MAMLSLPPLRPPLNLIVSGKPQLSVIQREIRLELCEVGFWVVAESFKEKYLRYSRLCWMAVFSLTSPNCVALRALRNIKSG